MSQVIDDRDTDVSALPRRRKFTVADYQRMGEIGLFDPDDRVELIDGDIYEMGNIGPRHAGLVNFLNEQLVRAAAGRFVLAPQNPVEISRFSEPQPDLALSLPRADFYRTAHPRASEVVLVIEVADSTVRWDRQVKMPMYGRQGIQEAWLIEIPRRVVTVYREPSDQGYRSSTDLTQGALCPLCLPELQIDIEELFGPP